MNVFELMVIWGSATLAMVGAVLWIGRDLVAKSQKK
jgi:hypothetical protein